MFCVDLRTNSDYFSIQPYLIGFYKQGSECLLRGMNWLFNTDSYSFVLKRLFMDTYPARGPSLWSSGQSFWQQIQGSRVRFPALPDFLSSSGSGTGSTQPREVN